MAESLTQLEQHYVSVDEALAIQSLAMQHVFPNATYVKDSEGMYRFMLYHSQGPEVEIGSGEVLSLMGVCLGRTALRRYTMRVSWLSMELTEEKRYSNNREVYRFDWMSDSEAAMATKVTYGHYGEITDTHVDAYGSRHDNVTAHISKVEEPLTVDDCDDLGNRMLETTWRLSA